MEKVDKNSQTDWSRLRDWCLNSLIIPDHAKSCIKLLSDETWPLANLLTSAYQQTMGDRPEKTLWSFVEQDVQSKQPKVHKKTSLDGYIRRIVEQGEVPVRKENVHDFFNFISFVCFPLTKKVLMKLQYEEALLATASHLGEAGGRGRTKLQDRLTIFDEGGTVLMGEQFLVFGHALWEQSFLNPQTIRTLAIKIPGSVLAEKRDDFIADLIGTKNFWLSTDHWTQFDFVHNTINIVTY
jgi:hypothetical protein